ncbi:hypothetical protein CLFE_048680 (plasmid) [Clostridium felsineum DSM 794]|nr:hypothetical protein CLFE_048680 [Clostridium felsineum DSM 794]
MKKLRKLGLSIFMLGLVILPVVNYVILPPH